MLEKGWKLGLKKVCEKKKKKKKRLTWSDGNVELAVYGLRQHDVCGGGES